MLRQKVLAAYKELLRLSARVAEGQRPAALAEARAALRRHRGEADLARQADLFKQLAARISFLRMTTPRVPGETSSIGAGHWVVRGGELVEGGGTTAGARAADGSMSMEDARRRHGQLLERQHFGRRPPAYNPSSF